MEITNETGTNPAGAQSRGAEGGTNLSGGLAALRNLATEWAAEGNFLTGTDDSAQDKAVGQVYKECAKELRALIGG